MAGIASERSRWPATRDLIVVLVKKRLREKHIGSILGYFWSFYAALFPLVTYVFVFFFIAGIEVAGAEGPWEYFLYVFSGLLPWLFFNRIASEGVDALNAHLDILKQAIFPVEVISIVAATENMVNLILQTVLLLICLCFSDNPVTWKLILLPIYLLLLYVFSLGLAWILSIIGFFIRDFKEVLTSLLGFLVYFTPVMYGKGNVPDTLWIVFVLNPMTHAINVFRDIVMSPQAESGWSWFVFVGVSLLMGVLGYISILSVKKSVGDMV